MRAFVVAVVLLVTPTCASTNPFLDQEPPCNGRDTEELIRFGIAGRLVDFAVLCALRDEDGIAQLGLVIAGRDYEPLDPAPGSEFTAEVEGRIDRLLREKARSALEIERTMAERALSNRTAAEPPTDDDRLLVVLLLATGTEGGYDGALVRFVALEDLGLQGKATELAFEGRYRDRQIGGTLVLEGQGTDGTRTKVGLVELDLVDKATGEDLGTSTWQGVSVLVASGMDLRIPVRSRSAGRLGLAVGFIVPPAPPSP